MLATTTKSRSVKAVKSAARRTVQEAEAKNVLRARSRRRLKFKAIEVAAMEFEMVAVFDTGSVFEIFTEAIILRKVSEMGIKTAATSKEVT